MTLHWKYLELNAHHRKNIDIAFIEALAFIKHQQCRWFTFETFKMKWRNISLQCWCNIGKRFATQLFGKVFIAILTKIIKPVQIILAQYSVVTRVAKTENSFNTDATILFNRSKSARHITETIYEL